MRERSISAARRGQEGFTVLDLMLVGAPIAICIMLIQAVVRPESRLALAGTILAALPMAEVVRRMLYRRLRLLPALWPPCPHCGEVPPRYRVEPAPDWPVFRIQCGTCHAETLMLLAPASLPSDHAPGLPRVAVGWFETWKRVG